MDKQDLIELKKKISELSEEEQKQRDLYLHDLATGDIQGPPVNYSSIDKDFFKWYSKDTIISDLPQKKFFDCIYENNIDYIDNIAFSIFGKSISYKELFEKVDKVARALKANNVQKGDVVTIAMLSTPEAIYTMLALNKIGAISYMVDPRTSVNGLNKYLLDNKSKLIITTNLFTNKICKSVAQTNLDSKVVSTSLFSSFKKEKKRPLKSKKKKISFEQFLSEGLDYNGNTYSEYEKGAPSVVVHSGGTTGFPKAVVMTDEKLLASVYQAMQTGIEFNREDTWLGIMPLFIIYGASTGTLLPLIKGMKIYLEPLFDPKKLPKIIKKHKPVHMTLAPAHFENIIYSKLLENEDLSYLIAPTVGGDSMNVNLEKKTNEWLKKHNCKYNVVKGYGASETCSGVTVCVSNECNKIGSVGIPLPKTVISIFNPETGEECIKGQSGEVCISGPTNMLKYFNSDEHTELVLKKHEDGKTWVHSGDWGYIDDDGMLYITDRIKRIIIGYSGFKILPSYVESEIFKTGLVDNCVVLGIEDCEHEQGEIPIACLVLKDKNDTLALEKIKKYLKTTLKDLDSFPRHFVLLDQIPILKNNGKIDVNGLKKYVLENNLLDMDTKSNETSGKFKLY